MASPLPPVSWRAGLLLLRLFTTALLLISVIVLTTNKVTIDIQGTPVKLRFNDVYAYRYMLAAAVIVLAYSLIQLFVTISQFTNANAQSNYLRDFYGDKIMSYMLATGSAAGFGVSKDLKSFIIGIIPMDSDSPIDKFFSKGYASASLLLIAFVCLAVLSVFSSLSLFTNNLFSVYSRFS